MGFFDKLKKGLAKTRETITNKIETLVLGYADINDDLLDELEEILIMADVGVNTTERLMESVRKGIKKKEINGPEDLKPFLMERITEILTTGEDTTKIATEGPTVMLVIGVNGVGKTTTIGKLSAYYKSQGKSVMLAAADTFRAAAIDQLEVVGRTVDVPVYTDRENRVAEDIALKARQEAERKGFDVLIVDTAGRLQIDEELMEELVRVKKAIKPHEILLVVDALTGQDAVNAAEGFNNKLGIDGIVMTKMDGDSRGGAALSAKKVTGKPVKFIGMGEKFDALEPFHPERMASRILGMGDMLSLIEKAQESYDEEKAAKLEKKIRKNEFTLEDFLDQMGEVQKMGGIGKMLEMLPGMNSKSVSDDEIEKSEKEFRQMEAIICSMTLEERRNPSLLNASRRKRIAAGSGQPVSKINSLIKKYEDAKKLMKQFSNPNFMKKNKRFKGLF